MEGEGTHQPAPTQCAHTHPSSDGSPAHQAPQIPARAEPRGLQAVLAPQTRLPTFRDILPGTTWKRHLATEPNELNINHYNGG